MYEAKSVKVLWYGSITELDLSKAFDLVNHSLLIQKLKLYRCDNSSINGFSLISNVTQRVTIIIIKQTLSEPKPITAGVPQGSILGPLLFPIHINDVPLSIVDCDVLLFADDATVTTSGDSIPYVEHNLNLALGTKQFSKWCNKNDMIVRAPKSVNVVPCLLALDRNLYTAAVITHQVLKLAMN